MSKRTDTILSVLASVMICLSCIAFVRPAGAGGVMWRHWRAEREQRAALRAVWPRITLGSSRLDTSNAQVELVEFSDYECPFCRKQHAAVAAFVAAHPNVGIVYRHFPLPIHPAAEGAARAAVCAEEQQRFRQMQDELFTTSDWQADSNWTREALRAGVPDISRFTSCLAAPGTTARIESDEAAAGKLGVRGTPTWVSVSAVRSGMLEAASLSKFVAGKLAPSGDQP